MNGAFRSDKKCFKSNSYNMNESGHFITVDFGEKIV